MGSRRPPQRFPCGRCSEREAKTRAGWTIAAGRLGSPCASAAQRLERSQGTRTDRATAGRVAAIEHRIGPIKPVPEGIDAVTLLQSDGTTRRPPAQRPSSRQCPAQIDPHNLWHRSRGQAAPTRSPPASRTFSASSTCARKSEWESLCRRPPTRQRSGPATGDGRPVHAIDSLAGSPYSEAGSHAG